MADRDINCTECNLYLGVIRDAKLRVKISFLCDGCETKRITMKMMKGKESGFGSGFDGIFDDTFGELFGNKRAKR